MSAVRCCRCTGYARLLPVLNNLETDRMVKVTTGYEQLVYFAYPEGLILEEGKSKESKCRVTSAT